MRRIDARRAVLTCIALAATAAAADDISPAEPLQIYSAGHKALFMCSAHYIAGRSAEDIKRWELAYAASIFNAPGDAWLEPDTRSAVGSSADRRIQRRAVFRDGMGCTLLGPGVPVAAAKSFPRRRLPAADPNARQAPWPNGDRLPQLTAKEQQLAKQLQPLLDAAFDGKSYRKSDAETPDTATLGVVILQHGRIIAERYRDAWGPHVQYRTYSAAKSFTNLVVGARVLQKRLDIDRPVLFPEWSKADDPRRALTTRHYLAMSSGLDCDGGGNRSLDTYFAGGRDAGLEAASRELAHPPGKHWCYSNFDSISVARAVRRTFDSVEDYLDFPYSALLSKMGMRDTVLETDSFGNFIMSSQIWTTPRDLARFGLLYLRDGVWNGERLLPEGWVKYTRAPVDSTAEIAPGRDPHTYGAQFWLFNDHPRLPRDVFTSAGHQGQYSTIVPSHDVVVTRMGLQDWQQKDFVADVLQAIGAARPQLRKELLYVGNTRDASISVISVPEHEVIKTWHVKGDPDDIIATRDGKTLFVSASGAASPSGWPDSGSILALDTQDGKLLWELPLAGWPHHISLTADDRTLYAPLFNQDHVVAIDTHKRIVVGKLYGLYGMHGTRLSRDDSKLYAGAILTSMMYVFDTKSGAQVNAIAFPEGVRPFAITGDQKTGYVQLSKLHGFAVMDLSSGRTLRTVALPPMAKTVQVPDRFPFNVNHGLELSPDERYLLAAGSLEGKVEVYTVPGLEHVKTIPVGADTNWIVFSSGGEFAYASGRKNNEVSVIDMRSLQEVKRLTGLGQGPSRMRIAPLPRT